MLLLLALVCIYQGCLYILTGQEDWYYWNRGQVNRKAYPINKFLCSLGFHTSTAIRYEKERGWGSTTKYKITKCNYCGWSVKQIVLWYRHPNWRGGKSFEPYTPEFHNALKEEIRERDNYTCQECGQTEEELGCQLSIHHINYDKKNNDPSNLISLCKICHGRTNYRRQYWTNHFSRRLATVFDVSASHTGQHVLSSAYRLYAPHDSND